MSDEKLDLVANRLKRASRVTILTGAGVSAASGVPTFRGSGGLWRQFRAEDLATPEAFSRDPVLVWEWYAWRRSLVAECQPNPAHDVIARWSREFDRCTVITQNVDDLHQRAGTDAARVIELHGNATRVRCLACGRQWPRDEIQERLVAGEAVPACTACGGILKPLTVLFGEPMPAAAVERAEERSRAAGCFLVVGSSLAVYPAAYMPSYAKEAGARLVVVNLTATRLDHVADVVLAGSAGAILTGLVSRVEARVARRSGS